MNRIQIATYASLAIAAGVIAMQFTQNTKLEQEAESLRTTIDRPVTSSRSRGGRDDLAARRDRAERPDRSEKFSAAVLSGILSESDPTNRIQSLIDYIDTLSASEIPAALDALRKSSPEWDPEAKMLAHIMLTRWAREDPDAAYASLATMDLKKNGSDASSILASLASMDPQRAAAWLNDPANALAKFPWMSQILAGTVAKEWVRQDPDGALAWASSLPKEQRTGAYTGVLGTLASSDPERASVIATGLEADDSRTYIVGEIAKSWARSSPESAMTWARELNGMDRNSAMNEALGTWAQDSPSAAAGNLDKLSGTESIDPYIGRVAANWAGRDPAQAAAWLAAQPEGKGKNDGMGLVAWTWTTTDPVAASTWLTGQPESPSRDSAIGGLAKAAFDTDPAGALSWATQMSNPEARKWSVDVGLREWNNRDPKAATDWATRNGVEVPAGRGK